MTNSFQIVISATDRATESIRRINQNINRITQPIREVRRATTDLGRELGFGKIAASFGGVTRSAGQVAAGVRKIIAPMAAVIGVGSIAGVAALATEWGHMGLEIANTSKNLGVAASDLQSLRGAAQMAGVSSEALAGGLLSLGDTINDAKWGRNQGALAMMRRLGVGIHMTADGSVDAVRGLKDMAGAIGKIKNVQTQHLVARTFGLEALLPLLRKGGAAIEEYQKKAAALGGVRPQGSVDRGEAFGVQLSYLSIATQGLKTSIGDKLVPVLMPLVEKLTNWIAANRELIATKVAQFVEGFVTWLNKVDFDKVLAGCTSFIKSIDDVVDGLGGWKNVAIGVGAVLTLNVLAPVLSLGVALASLTASTIPAAIKALIALSTASSAGGAAAAGAATVGAAGAAGAAGAGTAGAGAAAAGATALRLGFLGKLGLAGVLSYGALKVAKVAGLPDVDNGQGQKDVQKGNWLKASAHLSAGEFWSALMDKFSSTAFGNAIGEGLARTGASFGSHDAGEAVRVNTGGDDYGTGPKTGAAPLGIRSNNPLNMMPGGHEAVYPTMERGIAAALANLQGKRYFGGGNDTVAGIVNTWSPPNAPGNSPEKNANYIAGVTKQVGAGHLDGNDSAVMAKLLSAMIRQENGSGSYDKQKMDEAVAHVTVEFKGAPAGTVATAKSSRGADVPVRVAMSMPTLVSP